MWPKIARAWLLLLAVLGSALVVSAQEPKPGSTIENSIGMKLAYIPAGEYMRGSPESDKDASGDEKPQHKVRITKGFHMGTTEVTQGQWKAVMESEPWKGESFVRKGANYPASYVSWEDAVEFCKKLSEKEKKTYRLPTDAEWEYACRAGSKTKYSFGDDAASLGEYAWYYKNAEDVGEEYAHAVAQKKANAWGLVDMHGNVWEWCSDRYGSDYYGKSPGDDPAGPSSGSYRVYRGGCWSSTAGLCRSAIRYGYVPSYRSDYLGFRLALSPSGK